MAWVGGGSDEYKVAAAELNQGFVGMAFGLNRGSERATYGRLAGFDIRPDEVTLWLDGVRGTAGEVKVAPTAEVWFSHYTAPAQILDLLERVEKHVDSSKRR